MFARTELFILGEMVYEHVAKYAVIFSLFLSRIVYVPLRNMKILLQMYVLALNSIRVFGYTTRVHVLDGKKT